jgi:two-component system, OmpR family, phosphate regulon response regulator PhoB
MAREAPTVLVVDDDPAARRLVSIWLEERGFTVHDAQDGETGIREAARLSPDVVLLDWRLPDESGPSVCRRLSDAVPRPAIVMLTGLDDPRDRDAARKAGADDFLVKGLDPDTLADRLTRLIGARARFKRSTPDRAGDRIPHS